MMKTATALVSLISLAMFASPTAGAAPVMFGDNGHYYEVVIAPGISWHTAKTAAEGMMFTDPLTGIDFPGHLAIITTAAEDTFVENLRARTFTDAKETTHPNLKPEFWIGAEQEPGNAPDQGWNWITGEAPFVFTNWQAGEPNDFNGIDERFLGTGHTNVAGWNDEHNTGNIGGYVVEYDVNAVVFEDEDLDQCLESSGAGCDTTLDGAQTITIPDSAVIDPDPSLRATTFRLTDDPGRCGLAPLVLFGGDLIISPHHCATPETGYEFVVVLTEAGGIELREGTVRVVQEAKAALPDFPYSCDQPIPSAISSNDQEVVIYQRTNKEDMREFGRTWGPFMDPGDEIGATADITDSCGSSRARRAENSYGIIGMVQRFDPGSERETNPDLNMQRWVELARFKLVLLNEAIADSEPALSQRDHKQISQQALQALRKFDQADWQRAVSHLNNLERKVLEAAYDSSLTSNNDQGEALERLGSARFIIVEKIDR